MCYFLMRPARQLHKWFETCHNGDVYLHGNVQASAQPLLRLRPLLPQH